MKKELKYYREIELKKDNLTKIKLMFIRNLLESVVLLDFKRPFTHRSDLIRFEKGYRTYNAF